MDKLKILIQLDSDPQPYHVPLPDDYHRALKIDFGYKLGVCTGSIGDFVFNDANGDGLQAGDSGIAGVRVYLDSASAMYLEGATVDYVDSLMGGGFKIENPNAASSCSCGQSFSTEEGAQASGGGGGSGGTTPPPGGGTTAVIQVSCAAAAGARAKLRWGWPSKVMSSSRLARVR